MRPRSSVPRDNGGFYIAAPVKHVPQYLLQPREWRLSSDVFRGTNLLFRNQRECFSHCIRRVVERRLQRYFRIVQAVRIQFNFHSIGTTTEEIDGPTLADHFSRPLPRLRTS